MTGEAKITYNRTLNPDGALDETLEIDGDVSFLTDQKETPLDNGRLQRDAEQRPSMWRDIWTWFLEH